VSKQRARVNEADLSRIFRAAKKVGLGVRLRIEPDGTIVVIAGKLDDAPNGLMDARNPWDVVLEGQSSCD